MNEGHHSRVFGSCWGYDVEEGAIYLASPEMKGQREASEPEPESGMHGCGEEEGDGFLE